jgi:2-polyprenyl-3-methyl-5-hydroxy-6-metoxy-1,4-benzoquinol methylase
MDACPICGSSRITLKFNGFTNRNPRDGRIWPVFACKECGHGFINPQPSSDELSRYYSSTYEAYDEMHGAEGDDASVIARAVDRGEFRHIPIPTGLRVLDFGCGGGYFLNICRQLGAETQGIEPNPYGAELTRKQGLSVFEGSLGDFLAEHGDARFDVITSNHVIEHVPDPVATLAGLRILLADRGLMTIAVPNAASAFATYLGAEWHSTDLPFHLHQFSAQSLRLAAERAGLTTVGIETTSLPSASAHSFQLLLRRKWMVPQRLTQHLPGMRLIGSRIAARHDAERRGEALLARFAA